jgi:hypothetical protein
MMVCAVALAARGQTVPRAVPGTAAGGTPAVRGTLPGSRVLRAFDFEETKLGNYEATPMYWSKVVGRGYPAYSSGGFDHTIYRSSNTAFKLETAGGSVAYRFAPPAEKRIPVEANADYYVLAFVKSSGLTHARAEVVAWFADEEGNLMLPTEAHSQPYTPPPVEGAGTNGDVWQVLYIMMPGPSAGAMAGQGAKPKSLVLQVGLSQPQQMAGGSRDDGLGRFAFYEQDIKGAVWFDDIAVMQMPRVGVEVPRGAASVTPAGMFGPGEAVTLDVQMSDLTGGMGAGGGGQDARVTGGAGATGSRQDAGGTGRAMQAQMRITNADGAVVAQEEWRPQATAEKGWTQRYTHPALPAGLYTATMDLVEETGVGSAPNRLARRQMQFLCLPAETRAGLPAPEFGLGATSYTDSATWNELPLLLRQTGAGTIQLPMWRLGISEEALSRRDPTFEALLTTLQKQSVRIMGDFPEVPTFLQMKIAPVPGEDRASMLTLLNADAGVWRPYLTFPLTRYGQRFDFWEIGSPEAPLSGTLSADTGMGPSIAEKSIKLYERAYKELGTMLPRTELIIPWNALFDYEAGRFPHAALDLRLPAAIRPGQIPAYLENFRGATVEEGKKSGLKGTIFAHLEGLDPKVTRRGDLLADFAQRVVYAYASAPTAILYDVRHDEPDELLLVYATMIRALRGTQYQGELPLTTGTGAGALHAFLFRRAGGIEGSTVVLWSETAGKEAVLDLPLGPSPRTGDLLGNPKALAVDGKTHLTRVEVGTTPVVIENVQSQVLELTTSFALDTPMLPAGAGTVKTAVQLKNPYEETLTGSLRLVPPKGWTADPPTVAVSLPAGRGMAAEVTLRYPFTETAGRKTLGGRLTLDPGNPTGMAQMDVAYPMNVSSQVVEMEGFTRTGEGGDILLQQVITNTSNVPLDAQAYVLIPGFPRQQRYVVGLMPGQTTIKRFAFGAKDYVGAGGRGGATAEKMAAELRGASATLGVRREDGQTLLTRSVPLE